MCSRCPDAGPSADDHAALARVQAELPATARLTANRLTFAAFPSIGYGLTSGTVPQTKLWALATYDSKPRLNRMNGVSTIVVQGGQEPEFAVRPDPAKLLQMKITVPALLEAIGRSNLIDSPGLFEHNHQLVLSLVSGQARTIGDIQNIVVTTTPLGAPIRVGDIATVSPSVKPVYVAVTANTKHPVLLDADERFRAEGLSPEESMIRAGECRLRPMMMTALATIAGMIPLALAWGAASQMLQPLATAEIGGILASMVLSLVITPAVHDQLADRRR